MAMENENKSEEATPDSKANKPEHIGCYREDRPQWETAQVVAFRRRFGERLRFLRWRSGIDAYELSEILGVEPDDMDAWEFGRACPHLELLPFIAEALGLPNLIHLFPSVMNENGKETWLERGEY